MFAQSIGYYLGDLVCLTYVCYFMAVGTDTPVDLEILKLIRHL